MSAATAKVTGVRYYLADTVNKGLGLTANLLGGVQLITDSAINPLRNTKPGRIQHALIETSKRVLQHYPKRGWNYADIRAGKKLCPVHEACRT